MHPTKTPETRTFGIEWCVKEGDRHVAAFETEEAALGYAYRLVQAATLIAAVRNGTDIETPVTPSREALDAFPVIRRLGRRVRP